MCSIEKASDTWWRPAGTRSGYATLSQAVRYHSRKDGGPRNSAYVYFQKTKKPEILKSYLDRYKLTVQRYFPVPAGSPTEAFRPLTGEYPVFELIPQR